MAEVVLEKVTKVFAERKGERPVMAVNGIDLTIRDKEFLVLVGPSGCGKSTLLRMIAGLEEISHGKVIIDGRVCNDVSPRDRNIAMVFQNYSLYPHMTVEQNMGFALKLMKMPGREIRQRIESTAALLGLDELLHRKPRELSGGQRQRVALGRAIVRKPAVFLFDEPLSNLDAKMRVQMRVEISRLAAQLETTMIYVTHDQTEAMTMGERIVCMRKGTIQQAGAPMELYRAPANKFVAGFIGTPPMNFLNCMYDGQKATLANGTEIAMQREQLSSRVRFSFGPKTIGVRPESIRVARDSDPGINCVVDVVEPLGAETLVHCRLGADTVVARLDGGCAIKRNESIRIGFDPSAVHFFDRDEN